MHGAGLLVDRLVHAHAVEQRVERAAREHRVGRQPHRVDLFHQVAEHRALAAAAGRRPLAELRFEVFRPLRVLMTTALTSQSTCTETMSSMRLEQPLVAQVPDRQRLGRGAQRHQRQDLALVDVERQRMLAGDRRVARRAVFVDRRDVERRRPRRVGQQRPVGLVRRVHRGSA